MTPAHFTSVAVFLPLAFLAVGTLLNLSNHPHWFVRGWDFPRMQIVVIGWLLVAIYFAVRHLGGSTNVISPWPFLVLATLLTFWHGFRILPYTVLMPRQSAGTPKEVLQRDRDDPRTVRLVMSNVEMENDRYTTWMETMREAEPDILLVLEVDNAWVEATEEFAASYAHRIVEPRDNWYGMMFLSRLPVADFKIRHLVQDDVPSIDATVKLGSGHTIRFVGVHPRPPEPVRDNDATARDAELTLWGMELADERGPVIIGGDLNDVAWSATTRLFLRTSGLLDPRRGRGFYNSFHADHWYMRFPLDHVFHSPHFTLSRIERLGHVGSDHFPILIDLRLTPSEIENHAVLNNKESDAEEIESRIDRAVENEDLNGDAVDEGKHESIKDVDAAASSFGRTE